MVLESVAAGPLLRGVFFGLLGIAIWIAGLVFFNWLWHYFRDGDGSGSSKDKV